jgi:hypothetical protein
MLKNAEVAAYIESAEKRSSAADIVINHLLKIVKVRNYVYKIKNPATGMLPGRTLLSPPL